MSKGRILLVDDMRGARDLAGHMLNTLGYRVVSMRGAAEAIALIDHDQDFDILVTDISMPNMDGIALAHVVARRVPAIRILFVSGLPGPTSEEMAGLNAHYIAKPYRKIEMAQALARLGAV